MTVVITKNRKNQMLEKFKSRKMNFNKKIKEKLDL